MKKNKTILFLFLLLISIGSWAQQSLLYKMYIFDTYAYNPAVAGTQAKMEFMGYHNRQWVGFEKAPVSYFFAGTLGYKKNYGYKACHGFGFLLDQDTRGVFISRSMYVSYAIHLKFSNSLKFGSGIFLGGKSFSISDFVLSASDPALQASPKQVYIYPDIIPGFRLYNQKMVIDFSIKNLLFRHTSQGNRFIGTDQNIQQPHFYFTFRRKWFNSTKDWMHLVSLHAQSSLVPKPLVDIGYLLFFHERIGLGGTYTLNNSFNWMLHVRPSRDMFFGFAYGYPTNYLRFSNTKPTFEVMFGFTPLRTEMETRYLGDISSCPVFDF